jgi:hypothetical protein
VRLSTAAGILGEPEVVVERAHGRIGMLRVHEMTVHDSRARIANGHGNKPVAPQTKALANGAPGWRDVVGAPPRFVTTRLSGP